jgi:hypothetical protein
MANRVERLEFLTKRIAKLSEAAKEQMAKANQKNAQEFHDKVAQIVPHTGDDKGGDLRATLTLEKGETETGFIVAIGGPSAPYPAHLEHGHAGPDGAKVEATPFWYPAKRVLKKRHQSRRSRALKQAVDDAKGAI